MKPEKNHLFPRAKAAWILARVLNDHQSLEQAIDQADVDPSHRGWIMEICSGTLRWKGRIDLALDAVSHQKKPTGWMRRILSVSAYQLIAQDRVIAAKVVSETVDEVRRKEGQAPSRFANAILRKIADHGQEWRGLEWNPGGDQREQASWASLPVWFWEKLVKDHGLEWARQYAEASLVRPDFWVRTSDPESFAKRWGSAVEAGPVVGSFRWVEKPEGNVTEWPGFREGEFYVQDISSQRAVSEVVREVSCIFEGRPLRALDLCSAPGGKSLGLAWAGWNVDATDESAQRLQLLEQNINRIPSVAQKIRIIAPGERAGLDWSQYECVWLDAPCTGSGVVGRHPDYRWNKTPDQLNQLILLQKGLLKQVWESLKKGSVLVYSVCSVFKEEGEAQMDELFASLPGRIVAQYRTAPHLKDLSGDGFWLTILSK